MNCRYTIASGPTDEQPRSVPFEVGSGDVSPVTDVAIDDPYERVEDDTPYPSWLWVRLPIPNRTIWERVFADEARHDGLDYRLPLAPTSILADPTVRNVAPAHVAHVLTADIVTVEETAAFLRINVKTAYPKVRSGQIPGGLRIGGTVRVSKGALLEAFRRPPTTTTPRRRS